MYTKINQLGTKPKKYLELAKNIAHQSVYGKFRHGAVLVRGGHIVNTCHNKNRHCSFGNKFRDRHNGHATLHAELGCVLGLDRKITTGTTMYVVRVNRSSEFMMSKPCHMCHDVLQHCGVKKVVYTINEKEVGVIKL